jgi:hypothetical protein
MIGFDFHGCQQWALMLAAMTDGAKIHTPMMAQYLRVTYFWLFSFERWQ